MSKKNVQEAVVETSVVELTAEQKLANQVKEIASDTSKNVSYRIRELAGLGLKYGPIQKALNEAGYRTKNGTEIRFQHVRNVLLTQTKKV